MFLKPVLIAIFFCAWVSAAAQVAPLTLAGAVETSLQNNYDIQLSRNALQVSALDNAYVRYTLLPRLSASGSMLWNNNNQKQVLADGAKRERSGIKSGTATASLNLDWTLFDGMRMFIARDRFNSLLQLSELQVKAQVSNTIAEVMRLYYDVVRQQQQLQAIEEQMRLSEERLKLAQYKYDVGTGARPDLLQAQIDLNGQKSAQLTQQTSINKVKEQLNQLLVLPLENNFVVSDTTITFNPSLSLDSVRAGATATNPELLAAQKNLEIAKYDVRLIKAERYPVVEFNSAYNFNRTNNASVINQFQPLFNRNLGFNYGFTAIVPIFNGYSTRRLLKASELTLQAQELDYKRNLALVNTNIINAYRDYDLYKRALALEEENMVLVRENLFIARERYRLGITTFIELREAQQSLSDAAFRLIDARYNTKAAEIELMRLQGDLVK
jgi:outer membrane protein